MASVTGTGPNSRGVANPATNSTLVFAGDAQTFVVDPNTGNRTLTGGNQVIRGLTLIVDVSIEGTGIKGIINSLVISNTLTFNTNTAIVRTIYDDGSFTRNTSKTATVDLQDSGFLFNETNNAFIDGITIAGRTLTSGVKQTFGNIGLDITPNRDVPSPNVNITRYVGVPFQGPVGTSKSISRYFGVSGDVNNNTVSTITLHYLNSPNELNGNAEANLTIFKTGNNGVPFQLIGGNDDPAAVSVTQTGVTSINTVTLGDKKNPLPVTLTTFDAKRAGADALVTWETASELNNKGFNVQVSTNGKEFRTLGFVASASPNSVRATTYSYTDTEKNKTGLRYYRLMQVDTDGKTASFAPRAVSFDGKANSEGTTAFAYPNPFTSDVTLSLPSKTEGQGQVIITDMTGRMVSQRPITVGAGNNDVPLSSLGDLRNGIYMMHVTLPSGETKNLKVVKQ